MTLLLIALAIVAEVVAVAAILSYRRGRRRGRAEMLDAANSLLEDARQEGVAEGAALIQAVNDQHHCTDDECAIESQRRAARWQ